MCRQPITILKIVLGIFFTSLVLLQVSCFQRILVQEDEDASTCFVGNHYLAYNEEIRANNFIGEEQDGLLQRLNDIVPVEHAFRERMFSGQEKHSPASRVKLPGQRGVMESNIMMWLGVLVIIILLACVVFCVAMIIRQRKLSTIKNDFINNMTHEFKTSLATISLASQMLKDGTVTHTSETTERIASIILDESKRLTCQIERVLQTALFTESRAQLKLKKININEMIKELLPRLSLRVEGSGGKLSAHFNAEQDEVMADEVHVTNVLSNLVDNAIKYTARVPEIVICTSSNDREITISVKDNGIGIAKRDKKLIFERFYRVTGNLHDAKGFGLGLSYVKKIIEAHGGRVEVESSPGNGSRFDVILLLNKRE